MNPKYEDGTEAHLNDIVVVHRIDVVDGGRDGQYQFDRGEVLASVVDFHPDNKKCFELQYLHEHHNTTFRTSSCKLADFRDMNKLK